MRGPQHKVDTEQNSSNITAIKKQNTLYNMTYRTPLTGKVEDPEQINQILNKPQEQADGSKTEKQPQPPANRKCTTKRKQHTVKQRKHKH